MEVEPEVFIEAVSKRQYFTIKVLDIFQQSFNDQFVSFLQLTVQLIPETCKK